MQAEEAEAEAEEVRLAPMERGEWRGVTIIESLRPKLNVDWERKSWINGDGIEPGVAVKRPRALPLPVRLGANPQPTEMAMAVRWAVLFPGQTLRDLGLE